MHLGGIADHMVDQVEHARQFVDRMDVSPARHSGERLGTSAFVMNIAALLAAAQ
jgi:hypothetical protein